MPREVNPVPSDSPIVVGDHAPISLGAPPPSTSRDGFGPKAQATLASVAVLFALLAMTSSMTGLNPTLPAVAAGAFLFIVLLTGNRTWIVHGTLVVLFMTSVPEIPRGIRVGGIYVYFYEFLILGSFVYAVSLLRQNSAPVIALARSIAMRIALAFSLVLIFGLCLAMIRGYPFWDIQYDAKAIIEMMVVLFVTAVIVTAEDWRQYVKTITAILILSAVLMVYASATGFVLWGRTEAAELYASGGRVIAGGSDAVRYLTQTTPLALAVLVGCVALMLVGRVRLLQILPMLIPALIISILSFSRNSLLALAGAFVFTLFIALCRGHIARIVLRLAAVPLVVAIVIFGVLGIGSAIGARDWIDTQATGYANRVLAGFDESNERADTSAGYREQENESIRKAGAQHPVFGGGFGTHYKLPTGKRDTFPAFEGTMYSHNAYNWLYVKIGSMGVLVFGLLILSCLVPTLARKGDSDLLAAAGSTLAGLGVAIIVTPMPIEQPGSALLGIVMGLCIGGNIVRESTASEPR